MGKNVSNKGLKTKEEIRIREILSSLVIPDNIADGDVEDIFLSRLYDAKKEIRHLAYRQRLEVRKLERQLELEKKRAEESKELYRYSIYKNFIEDKMQYLSRRQQKVLCMRFGFQEYPVTSLEQIGQEFGVTRERIRQILDRTVSYLRKPFSIGSVPSAREQMLSEREQNAILDKDKRENLHFFQWGVDQIGLSNRVVKVLHENHIKTVSRLISNSEEELRAFPGIGNAAILEIKRAVGRQGYFLQVKYEFRADSDEGDGNKEEVKGVENSPFLEELVEVLNVSRRTKMMLKYNGFNRVKEVVAKSHQELYELPGIGEKSIREIEDTLSRKGITLK